MITIYGVYRSRASRNIWALEELGLPWRLNPVLQAYKLEAKGVPTRAPDAPLNTHSAEFLRLSPMGAVPVLEDDGFVLTESLAINLYLARKAGGPIAPRDAREDALMSQWALFGATWIEAAALRIQQAQTGRDEPEPDLPEADLAALKRPFGVLESHLGTRSHMVGGRFTIADINMAEIVRYASGAGALMAAHPRLSGWLGHCQARPAFRKMWARREAEPA